MKTVHPVKQNPSQGMCSGAAVLPYDVREVKRRVKRYADKQAQQNQEQVFDYMYFRPVGSGIGRRFTFGMRE